MKVLMTGATGFVGKAVVDKFLQEGHSVIAAVRQMSTELPNTVEQVVIGDLAELPKVDSSAEPVLSEVEGLGMTDSSDQAVTDSSAVRRLSAALRGVDVVIHTAARVHVMNETEADPIDAFRKVNTEATLNLARQAAESGVKRFIFISTIKVNGESTFCFDWQPDAPIPAFPNQGERDDNVSSTPVGNAFQESDKPNPQDPYAISKWEAEQGLMQIAEETGMEVMIIRPPLVYGPGVKGNFATMMKWLKRGIPLPLGAVQNQRSLLALDNLVSFILLCMEHPKAVNQTFVLADGEDVSTSQLLNKIAQAMNKRARLLPVPVNWMVYAAKLLGKQAVAERLFGSLQIDISKAKQLLGWRPVVSMDEQLARMNEHEISRRNLP